MVSRYGYVTLLVIFTGVWLLSVFYIINMLHLLDHTNIRSSDISKDIIITEVKSPPLHLTTAENNLITSSSGSVPDKLSGITSSLASQTESSNIKISPKEFSVSLEHRIEELFNIGSKSPVDLLNILQTDNPLGLVQNADEFQCPHHSSDRLTSLSNVNYTRAKDFRDGKEGSWIFYQHLRKAGGTGFCDLARNNMNARQVPPYYCMIDDRGSLCTPPWNDSKYLISNMRKRGFRVTANEWDVFHEDMFAYDGAVFATTFRHPVDRWYSQYRFEHLEHRDGSAPDAPRRPFKVWYNNNKNGMMGPNYYVTTFYGGDESPNMQAHGRGDFYWTYRKFIESKQSAYKLSWNMFKKSLENVKRFNLVLITEYLSTSSPVVMKVLGWTTPPRKVLPHENQWAKRNSSDSVESLVGSVDYRNIVLDNIYDLLLFHCVQRLYLERYKCHDLDY